MDFRLTPVDFAQLPGWAEDDPSALAGPMARCLKQIKDVKPYKTGRFGLLASEMADLFSAAVTADFSSAKAARAFFEQHCRPFRVQPASSEHGFVTAFYEPEVEVDSTPSADFAHPFYTRPADLIDIDDSNRPEGFDTTFAFGQSTPGGIVPYPDRKAIEQGYLAGRGLEIAWAGSRVDLFFAQVQGAARLTYPDGSMKRITYAAKTGHAFTGIGRLLVEMGEIPLESISMQAIRDWLAHHPERADEIIWQNQSYIFFREAEVSDPALGPIAAAKVALEPMRSIAVDRLIHTFGSLFYIDSPSLKQLSDGNPFRRLMIALDTGSAIIGPARADIFTGSGALAGDRAGAVRNAADFYILIPRSAAERYV
jgi:membrane-bound lytic murein transglycosylase A